MAKSDIFLRENRVSVIGGEGDERVDGTERGDLEVRAGEEKDPSIRLNADWANLVLGGGEGKSPEGDLKIRDSQDRNRIVATAEDNNSPDSDTRVWLNGGNGSMALGSAGETKVQMDGDTARIELSQPSAGDSGVTLEAKPGDGDERRVGDVSAGQVRLFGQPDASEEERVRIVGDASEDGVHARLQLYDDENLFDERQVGVDIRTLEPENSSAQAPGVCTLYDDAGNSSVEIQGQSATLHLGYSYMTEGDIGDLPQSVGRSGRLILDDGASGSLFGTAFGIEATGGQLRVTSIPFGEDEDPAPLLVIDPGDDNPVKVANGEGGLKEV